MELSSAAARCGLYTASRTGFSSNRQLSVLPALNAYKPTLHVLFFCFVSHYSSAACNIQFIFQENLSWSAQLSNNRMHAPRTFYCHKQKDSEIKALAEEIGKILEIPVDSKSLIRTRKTSPQKKLGHQERKKNLKHAFAVKHTFQAVKRVLLVDDIYTTGNTIDAVSNVLKQKGVENVYFLTISIGQGY